MASVFLAVHQDVPNLKVVLKVLSDQRLVDRFRQEADKLALLDGHPHVCQLKHFFSHGDEMVIAMEYIDGPTLDDIVKKDGPVTAPKALAYVMAVLETLEFAHQKRMFHRDIKPSNIMIDAKGAIKIIDFGIAKGESDPNLTLTGSSCGTPAYMAPEQFNPSAQINYALADVYAVGTTLFYLLTGKLPFAADNPFALRDAKLFGEPLKPRDIDPDISKSVQEIILKAIDKEPEKRFQSAAEMQAALRRELPAQGTADSAVEITTAASARRTAPAKSRGRLIPILGSVGVLAALVAGYFLLLRPNGKPPLQAAQLMTPTEGSIVVVATPQFSWTATAPPGGNYNLEISGEISFLSPKSFTGLAEAHFVVPEKLGDGNYFWRVQIVDINGTPGPVSPAGRFTVELPADTAALPGTLIIAVRPSGDIYLDGEFKSKSGSSGKFDLSPGPHIIKVMNAGSSEGSLTDTILIASGEAAVRNYSFTMPAPPPQPPSEVNDEQSNLRIASNQRNVAIYIDGERQNRPPPFTYKVKAGRHIIRAVLVRDGLETVREDTIDVAAGTSPKIDCDF